MQTNHNAVNPFFLSTKGYGILWDNYSETQFDNETDINTLVLRSEVADEINYYFVYAENSEWYNCWLQNAYRVMLPFTVKWAYGYWQSKERYKSQDDILGGCQRVIENVKFPLTILCKTGNIGKKGYWNDMKFDKERFPLS